MAASAHLLLSALSKRPADLSADFEHDYDPDPYSDAHLCALSAEGSCAEAPLTSEPPLPDAAPLTSEPPLADAAPMTSESAFVDTGADLDLSVV
ncbi:hypothetical protein [Streptomyces cavernae]|uniref:hypothetical protein n=1 Tax=Streptomyces cavernae TaxID=2259034 RepID=UPI000FEBC1C4|nr:hypothetical protein [Streptomyces cavernae]